MNNIYIEPFSGLSGDMFLSALCGLTNGYDLIQSLPEKLNLSDGKIQIQELNKNGIVCKHVKIIDLNQGENSHSHYHHHDHDHHHSHDHHHHLSDYIKMGIGKVVSVFRRNNNSLINHSDHHHNRGLNEINKIIEEGDLTTGAKTIAKAIFNIIGQSESKIHNIPMETIHFHEVSGVDSILDIVGCAVLIDQMKIDKVYSDPICTGYGMVKTAHGMLPVPAPATFDIMSEMPIYKGNEKGEKLTPTGAAILKYLSPDFKVPVLIRKKTAYGPGEKDFRNPNVVRISFVTDGYKKNEVQDAELNMTMIETNMDDTSSELLGNEFQNELINQGARDFYYSYIQMKKGRPGIKLSVLTETHNVDCVADFIMENTSSIGLRYYPVSRNILPRENITITTKYGNVDVKEVTTPSGLKRHKVEYESLKRIKSNLNISMYKLQKELYDTINSKLTKN